MQGRSLADTYANGRATMTPGGVVSRPNGGMARPTARPSTTGAPMPSWADPSSPDYDYRSAASYVPPPAMTDPRAQRIGGGQPGMMQRPVGQGLPNGAQMSPQAQAMIQQFLQQQQAAAGNPQAMAAQHGVFSGQMQPTQMGAPPPMNLPQLWSQAPRG
jgi:hypothetical protein